MKLHSPLGSRLAFATRANLPPLKTACSVGRAGLLSGPCFAPVARVAELADALDSGSSQHNEPTWTDQYLWCLSSVRVFNTRAQKDRFGLIFGPAGYKKGYNA